MTSRPLLRSLALALATAAPLAPAAAPGASPALPDDPLLHAMRDELKRSIDALRLGDLDRPYFVEYGVADTHSVEVTASFGAVLTVEREHERPLRVDVRVGSYEMDSSQFLGARGFFGFMSQPTPLPLDDAYGALRREIWLATDAAYKTAVEQLARKKAYVANKREAEPVPDFAPAAPVVAIAEKAPALTEGAAIEDLARRLSSLLREFPAIEGSQVTARASATTRYFVNSEGSVSRQPQTLVSLVVNARTQSDDGMPLAHFVAFHAPSLAALPKEGDLAAAIRRMAGELTALRDAPAIDQYIGPVLVTDKAAPEMIATAFAPHLSGDRPPLIEDERMAASAAKSDLADRVNRRVLPPFLSLFDDPSLAELDGEPLIGHYAIDDQGMQAQRVPLVTNGVLKGLLLSRRPRKGMMETNGHARSAPGAAPQAAAGVLVVEAGEGQPYDALKRELIELCKEQELPYGLIVRALDNAAITGDDGGGMRFGGRGDRSTVPPPLLAYRVHVEDGREELVRGLKFGDVTTRSFKDIIAAGSDRAVQNRLSAASLPAGFGIFFGFSGSGRAVSGIPTTVVAPSLLFEELELERAGGALRKPPLLPHPFFARE